MKPWIFRSVRKAGMDVMTKPKQDMGAGHWTTGTRYLWMQVAGCCWPGSVFRLICRTAPKGPAEGRRRGKKSKTATIHQLNHNFHVVFHVQMILLCYFEDSPCQSACGFQSDRISVFSSWTHNCKRLNDKMFNVQRAGQCSSRYFKSGNSWNTEEFALFPLSEPKSWVFNK